MTMPNDPRTTGTPPPGSRASDYASSRYYLPPVPPPGDDADPDGVDVDGSTGPPAAYPVGHPTPDLPVAPAEGVRRSRGRSRPALGVALVLALVAALLGGGYWMLHRHDDTAAASPAGRHTTAAAAATTGNGTGSGTSAKTSATYLFRPAKRHWTVRMPHRPTTQSKRNAYGAITGSEIAAVDGKADAGLVWVRVNVEIPAARQDAALRGGIAAFVRSSGRTEVSTRTTTFHGRLARVSALKSSSGKRYTALAVVFQPSHVLFVVAPTGHTYDLMTKSFRYPV